MTLQIHNTLTNKTDTFKPLEDSKVTLYTCGPTVYNYPHVGNWAAYVYWDILVRILLAEGYQVERVMNITDVGHLVSDADEGEDKLEKGARREGKTAWEIAEFYAEDFVAGMEKLGLIPPEHLVKATDFIPQQLDLIRILKEKGYTYQTHDGIYFDTTKFPTYADFAHLDLDAQKAGARVEVNAEKHSPSDFALWKFTPAGQTRDMQWETPDDLLDLPRHESANERVTRGGAAPAETTALADIEDGADRAAGPAPSDLCGDSFGIDNDGSVDFNSVSSETVPNKRQESGNAASSPVMGFPGWHLECSAMAMSILGPTIDIHTGGIDHIPVHHTNEIAQSEAASGQRFANYWLHNNHIKSNGTKISKSLNNGYTLQDLEAEGFSPLDYRMFILQGQFTNEGNFTFENLEAAKNRLRGWRGYAALRHQTHDRLTDDSAKSDSNDNHVTLLAASGAVKEALANNLNTPAALSIIDDAFSQIDSHELDAIYQHGLTHFIETIDELLGLQLADSTPDITDEQKMLILERQRAREAKDWAKSDKLRDQLAAAKIALNDTPTGTIWSYL